MGCSKQEELNIGTKEASQTWGKHNASGALFSLAREAISESKKGTPLSYAKYWRASAFSAPWLLRFCME